MSVLSVQVGYDETSNEPIPADAVAWLSNMDFGCQSSTNSSAKAAHATLSPNHYPNNSCTFRRLPGVHALRGPDGGHKLAKLYNQFAKTTTPTEDTVHRRRYFYVTSEEECLQLCCGLRDYCDVYIVQPITKTQLVSNRTNWYHCAF